MVRPIPKKLLIHEIEYYEKIDGGRYDDGYKDPIVIKNVLVQPSSSVKKTNSNEEKLLKGLLFIDVVNSSPAVELKAQSKVNFKGEDMFVQIVKPCYAFKLHHWEVELT